MKFSLCSALQIRKSTSFEISEYTRQRRRGKNKNKERDFGDLKAHLCGALFTALRWGEEKQSQNWGEHCFYSLKSHVSWILPEKFL